jgi:alpha-beta hydrolase superfamily lysophospholipase
MTMMREDVTFLSGGETCAAWLYPAGCDDGVRPIIVMAHGVTGTRRDGLWSFADRFAAAGINALVFDHRGFGDSEGERDLFEPDMQLDDWRAAIAFARSLENVDPDRLATFGSSLGGGNALWAASDDPRVAAAISQVPFVEMSQAPHPPEILEQMLEVAASGGYLPAVGQPDEPAMINQPGGEVGWRRVVAMGDQSRWRNRMSAAWLLKGYNPGEHAATLHCPWLVCIAEDDRIALPGPAIDAALRAPKGEIRIYPELDHFDIYDGPAHEAVVADEIEFLHRHLLDRQLLGAPKASTALPRVYLPAGTGRTSGA